MNILSRGEEEILNNAKQEFQTVCIGKNILMDPKSSKQLQGHASCVKTRIDSFRSPTFIVTCVGMLKSGKSTLVNLFAQNPLASPTGYGYDTTLRPALIMASREPTNEGEIEIWFSIHHDHDEQSSFENLFTYLRGVDDTENIKKEFSCHKVPLTENNLTNALCKKAREAEDNLLPSEPALVVVKVPTHEDSLLSSEIMILDTPGLDSGLSEWTKDLKQDSNKISEQDSTEIPKRYSWIINNSDLLLFLQSSVAPLNQKATDILKCIHDSKTVVWLVHNEMITKPWLNPDYIMKTTEEQRRRSNKMFSKTNHVFDQFNANLGKAACASFDKSELLPGIKADDLLKESQFPSMKEKIKKDLLDRIVPIRRVKCKNNLKSVLKDMQKSIEEVLNTAKSERRKIEMEIETTRNLADRVKDWLLDPPQKQSFSVVQNKDDIEISTTNPFGKEHFINILRNAYVCDFSAEKYNRKDVQNIIEGIRDKKLFKEMKDALEKMSINHFSLSLQGGTVRQNNIPKYLRQQFSEFVENLVITNCPANADREKILLLIKQNCMQIKFPDVPKNFNVYPDVREVPIDVPQLLAWNKRVMNIITFNRAKNWTQRDARTAFLDYFDQKQTTGKFINYIDKLEKDIRTNFFSWLNKDFYEYMRDRLIKIIETEIENDAKKKQEDVDQWEQDSQTLGEMLIGCQKLAKTLEDF